MSRTGKVFIPHSNFSSVTGRMQGKGGSILISQGGPGAGSSYTSVDDYVATTGVPHPMAGKGLENLGKKLESLSLKQPKPMKVKNIKFNL